MTCYIIHHVIVLFTIFYIHQTSKEQARSSLSPAVRSLDFIWPFFIKVTWGVVLQLHSMNFERQFAQKADLIDLLFWHSQDTSLTISHSHLQNLPSPPGERASLWILKEQRAAPSCNGLDILHLFTFFFSEGTMFLEKTGMRLTTPFLSTCLILDALTVRWDNLLSAPFWVALAGPQIQPDETCRHAVSFSVHCVAQCFSPGLGREGGVWTFSLLWKANVAK